MPIYLDVQPRLDDRAARSVSDQAKKHFSDAGKSAGQDFSKALSAGLSSSDAAVRKSAENTEKAFKRAADAAGQTRVEEAKLEDLRTKGTGGTAMLTQSERLEKARRAETATTRTAVTALRDLDTAQTTAVRSGSALLNLLAGIASGASGTRLGGMASQAESLSSKLGGISPMAAGATAGIAGLVVGVGAAGKALYDLGAAWDDIGDTITGRTGIMGDQLTAITDRIKQVGSQSALSFGDISQFAGGVVQSLHLTGDAATEMTQKLADVQQVTGQAVSTKDLGKAFRLFDVTDINTEIQTLQQLTAASQATDIPINDLLTTLGNTGKASKEAGLNLQQTLGVLLTLEDAGVSFDKAGPALSIALKNWSKDGRDANVALAETITQINTFIDAGNNAAATKLASETFGKGYIDFLDAIKGGNLDVGNLTAALEKLSGTGDLIGDQKNATEDWHESWKKLTNTISSKLEPVANTVFTYINTELQYLTGNLSNATQGVETLSTTINSLKPDALANALGMPSLPGAPAAPAGPGLPTTRPGAPTTGLGPNFYKDWYKTPEELKREQGSSALPQAPAVPYDTSLPTGFAGVPQTSEIVGAENSWMDARHTLAEKQARLDQLEKDNNATADDITKARNDVINAQQGQNQTELRLYDARQSLYDKETKRLKGHTDALGEFGAKLDQDFGISKGLPGIAENLTKFLGNLIAAPFLSQMSAISDASPSKGGFGLMGILGAQGAFGPQFTGIDYSKQPSYGPSVMGPAAPGGSPGTAMPGESARDFAHRVEMPFWQSQGYQVGDHAADKYGEHQNGALDIMVGSIAEGNKVLQQVLSDPNVYGAIFNNQTYGYGHGTTPQPYGSTGGPTDKHEDHVHAWYRPGNSGDITPLPGGSQPGSPAGTASTPGTLGSSGVVPVSVTNWPGAALGGSGPGQPPGQGPGAPQGAPGSGLNWDALAAKESGGNWSINTGNGYSGGLQFDPSTWAQYGGTQYAPSAGEATKDQQIAVAQQAYDARGGGSTLWPQNYGQLQAPGAPGTWGGPGLPAGITGGGGQSPVFGASPQGPGLGASATAGILGGPGVGGAAGGPGVGPTTIGGVEPPKGSGQGGIGITPGGSIDTALGVAASMFPGLGQAAQTGVKLASRAIQYGGQVAGIATQGVMDTFLPTGGSELANHSWLSKIVGGLAGAAPALPNMAGKPAAPPAKDGSPASGQGQGPPPGPPNITVNNNRATEDGTGRDVAYHMQNMYQPAGQP